MRRIFSGFDLQAVHHAKNLLEAEGIACTVRNEHLSSGMGELPPIDCQIELWVLHARDAARAEALLREGPRIGDARAWRCASCGEPAEAQFTQCWRCGALRPAAPDG